MTDKWDELKRRKASTIIAHRMMATEVEVELAGYVLDLLDENEKLRAALRGLVELCRAEYEGEGYGPFPGGDPRNFKPDEEDCTKQELENWRNACEEWERGEGVDRGPSCQYRGDGSAYTGTGFGVGTYRFSMPEVDVAIEALGDAP